MSLVAMVPRAMSNLQSSRSCARNIVALRPLSRASIRSTRIPHLIDRETLFLNTRQAVVLRAGNSSEGSATNDQKNATAGLWVLWLALLAYATLASPNLTPLRDEYFLEKLVGLGENDGVKINQIFTAIFNIMGVIPGIYASLLIPGARSENKVPAWPFVSASFFLGAFALVPYMALWQPKEESDAPPKPAEFEGWKGFFMKALESPVTPVLLLVAAVAQVYLLATATAADWDAYGHLLDESRFVHVTSLDFLTLTALMPFWMNNDAAARNWDKRESYVPFLSLLPIFGPLIYLLLRPRAEVPK